MKQFCKVKSLILSWLLSLSLLGCAGNNDINTNTVQLSSEKNGCLLKIKFSEMAHFDGPGWLLFLRQSNYFNVELRFPTKLTEIPARNIDYKISSDGMVSTPKIYSGTVRFEKQIVNIDLYFNFYNDESRLTPMPVNGVHEYRGSCSKQEDSF
ncbi:hypothetical protein [Glaciecola sp. MF2-115]|uniref:hypothetical protein n=1 Tax=Glaciecola sp. MF2-115 TaxID=3384827 RepID=UPI00399F3FBD